MYAVTLWPEVTSTLQICPSQEVKLFYCYCEFSLFSVVPTFMLLQIFTQPDQQSKHLPIWC